MEEEPDDPERMEVVEACRLGTDRWFFPLVHVRRVIRGRTDKGLARGPTPSKALDITCDRHRRARKGLHRSQTSPRMGGSLPFFVFVRGVLA